MWFSLGGLAFSLGGMALGIFYALVGIYGWKWIRKLEPYASFISHMSWHNARKCYVLIGAWVLAIFIGDALAVLLSFESMLKAPLLIIFGIPPAYYLTDTLSRRRNNLSLIEFLMSKEDE